MIPRPPDRTAALCAGTAALFAFALSFFRIEDLDWHWYLGVGRWIVEHGAVPHTEPFSFTAAGAPYRAEHWLGEVLFYLIHAAGGTAALVTLKALLFAAMAAALTLFGARRVGPAPAALVTALVLLATLGQMRLRLYVLAPALALLMVLLLERWRSTGRGRWWLPLIALLWMNLHGSGSLAVAIVGAYLVGEALMRRWAETRRLLPVLIACALATLINPYGWGLWQEAWAHAVTERHHDLISEFLPLSTLPWWRLGLLGLLIALMLGGWLRSRGRGLSPGLLIVCVAFLLMSVGARRHLSLFLWPAGVMIFQGWGGKWDSVGPMRPMGRIAAWVTCVLLVALAVLTLTDRIYLLLGSERRAGCSMKRGVVPEEALDELRAFGVGGRLFTTYENGGLVIARAPEFRVFIDNRYRPFEAILGEYANVAHAAPGWQQVLDRWEINLCLVDPALLDLIEALHQSPLWSLVALTGDGAVFARRSQTLPEIEVTPAIAIWRGAHPLPGARWPWQADPYPREHLQMARMAERLGAEEAARRLSAEVSNHWP
ncbi:hypothetical protein JXA47_00750 [Candidatus Sumerlaeota bacterium]|nr:hypothetical protein [Candidatus Sumerlaeota bacterium]